MNGILDLSKLKQDQQVVLKEPSFLKRESVEEVSVIFSQTKQSNNIIQRKLSLPIKKISIFFIAAAMILTIGGFGFLSFAQADRKFYVANWEGVLSAEERTQGVKTLSYEFKADEVIEEVVSRSNDVEITAKLSSKIQLVKNFNNTSTFKIEKKSIKSIEVEVPDFYCQSNPMSCLEVQKNFEETFRNKIEEQNKLLENQEFKLTKLQNSKIKLQSDVLGDRFLNLSS